MKTNKYIQRLQLERNKQNLSLRKLAEELDITYATINNWENGKTSPTVTNYLQWCEALNLKPFEL